MNFPQKQAESGKLPLSAVCAESQKRQIAAAVGAGVLLLCTVGILLRRGWNLDSCVTAVRLGILVFAAAADFSTRRVANTYATALLFSGFYGMDNIKTLFLRCGAALAVFLLLFTIYCIFPQKSVGGADIKLLTALTFALGQGIVPSMFYSLCLCLLLTLGLFLFRRKEIMRSKIPLVPLLAAGVCLYDLF